MRLWISALLFGLALFGLTACGQAPTAGRPDRTRLQVLLIPADGGTESGTLADYRPLFDVVSRQSGIDFDLKVAQSYGAVVEAMCNGTADIAFVGAVTFLQARQRGCAELLAVAVKGGQSIYYSGLFVARDSPIRSIEELHGKRLAMGDVNSTSSFVFPVAMLLDAGIDPAQDLAQVRLTGTHAGSLSALIEHQVDAAALSFDSYNKAVREGMPGARDIRVLARSEPIPYPPLIVGTRLPSEMRDRLRQAFQHVSQAEGVTPATIRGYGGAVVDGYDPSFPVQRFTPAAEKMAMVSDRLKGELLRRAGER